MWVQRNNRYTTLIPGGVLPNVWDFIAFAVVMFVLIVLAKGASDMHVPYQVGESIPIYLSPDHLPYYALRSVLRMLIALLFSLGLTFVLGAWAAKSRRAETIIISMVDVLQSAPVLSFLAIAAPSFIALFPGSLLGPECAAIFAIITSQAWNMILSFYQSVRTVPAHYRDVCGVFNLSSWQQFWRIEVPYAMPSLIWNMMISMSASWFFVVASEAIIVSRHDINLPGIGSYIALAIKQHDVYAVGYAIAVMFVVIWLYNELLFKPLHQWSHKFQAQDDGDDRGDRSIIATLFLRSKWFQGLGRVLARAWDYLVLGMWFSPGGKPVVSSHAQGDASWFGRLLQGYQRWWGSWSKHPLYSKVTCFIYYVFLLGVAIASVGGVAYVSLQALTWREMLHVCWLGLYTGFKVMVLIFLSSLIWVPVGVYIGLRPKLSRWCQPLVQMLAAFPANLFFPLVVIMIVKYDLNVDVWTAPLMVLGTQWYILFNVIAGAEALPKQLRHAASSFGLRGWHWWKRLGLPAIFPYFVTGAVTAAGGAWNASIVAEVVEWGAQKIEATGLGAYIALFYEAGDFHRVIWGTAVMCFYVLIVNHFVWQPLYHYAEERFQID
jgi:NitT/TauT family transport system permease protein